MDINNLQIDYLTLNHFPYKGYFHFSNIETNTNEISQKLVNDSGLIKLYHDDKSSHLWKKIEITDKKNKLFFCVLDKDFSDEGGRHGIVLGFYISFELENFNFDLIADIDKLVQQYFENAARERKKGSFCDGKKLKEYNNELLLAIYEVLQNSVTENCLENVNSLTESDMIENEDFNEYHAEVIELTKKLKQASDLVRKKIQQKKRKKKQQNKTRSAQESNKSEEISFSQ